MPELPSNPLSAEQVRAQFFARREERESARSFWRTIAVLGGMSLVVGLLLRPASLLLIDLGGPRVCLAGWVVSAYGYFRLVKYLVPLIGASWERALHDRISAEIRVLRHAPTENK